MWHSKMFQCLIVLSLTFSPAAVAYADPLTAAEKQAAADAALVQLNSMRETLENLSQDYFKSLSEYQEIREKCKQTQNEIDKIENDIAATQEQLQSCVSGMYKQDTPTYIDLLLDSKSFQELVNNWDYLNRINQYQADTVALNKQLRAEYEIQKESLEKQEELAKKKSDQAANAYHDAQLLVEQLQVTYDSLSAEAKEIAAQAQDVVVENTGYYNEDGTVTDATTGQVYASAKEYSAATGNEVVDRARAMLGSAYVWGGVGGNDGGFDCSGLVSYAITGENVRLGTTYTFMGYNQVTDPQPGDICVSEGHTGIYTGDGNMVHAADYGIGVIESPVQDGMIYVRP